MLRLIFVFGIIAVGVFYSLQSAFYVLLFYLWNAYFRPESWVWSDMLWSLRLSLIIGIFLLLASIPSLSRIRWSRLLVLIAVFLVHSGISLAVSPYASLAVDFWIEFVKVIIVMVLITVLVDSEERYRLTLMVVAFSLGFEAAKQGWAQLVLNPGATNNNPHLMLGDNNGVAMGMMMLIPIFMALAQTSATRWQRYIHHFFIGGLIYRAVSTYSRGGFLAAAVVGIVSLWRAQHKIRTIVMVSVFTAVVVTAMPQAFWDRMQTITASEDERDESAQSRLFFWSLAQQMANDNPLFGVGFNSYRYAFGSYSGFGGSRAVHSVWFGLMSELGYTGLMLFIAILIGALLSCHRIRRQATAAGLPSIAIYASHLQTSFLAFIIGGTFLNAQYLELVWHLFGLTIALETICQNAVARAGDRPAIPDDTVVPATTGTARTFPSQPPREATSNGGRFFELRRLTKS